MATFVLVHGAWHGGWCWARVAPRLRADRGKVRPDPGQVFGVFQRLYSGFTAIVLADRVSRGHCMFDL